MRDDELIHLYMENRLNPEQVQEFCKRIRTEEAFARLFVRYGLLSSAIRDELVEADLQAALSDFAPALSDKRPADLGDTTCIASEQIMDTCAADEETPSLSIPKGDQDTLSTPEIKQYAERQLQTFLAEQEALRRPPRPLARRWSLRPHLDVKAIGHRVNATLIWAYRGVIISAVAAALVLATLVGLRTYRANRVVATLMQETNAQWASAPQGMRLRPGSLVLEKGFAQIEFKGGARVILQAPSAIELQSDYEMFMQSGWMTAKLPERARGFTVFTPHSRVVDYGTEFGLTLGGSRNTELHVFDGVVGLGVNAGQEASPVEEPFKRGQAAILDRGGRIERMALQHRPQLFVREMPQGNVLETHSVTLDLADVIGGGNGFGSGDLGYGIHPATGARSGDKIDNVRWGNSDYRPVYWNDFIDGVFVPCLEGRQILSSQGHVFRECPVTCKGMFTPVQNGGLIRRRIYEAQMVWDGKILGTHENPCILMHSNLGVTLDLQALQDSLPGYQIKQFRSQFGICEHVERPYDFWSDSEFWVLVDGRLRFHRKVIGEHGPVGTIAVDLTRRDRFLTLATTDGGDGRPPDGRATSADWCLFVEPVLEMDLFDSNLITR